MRGIGIGIMNKLSNMRGIITCDVYDQHKPVGTSMNQLFEGRTERSQK